VEPRPTCVREPQNSPQRVRAYAHAALAVAAAVIAVVTGGCASVTGASAADGVRVVAAENFWGSIARQIGGAHATVISIISNPATDPHSYEPTTGNARALATAQLAIVNGVSYDPWAPKLLAADPAPGRRALSVGHLLGLPADANPHRWYDPDDVTRVAAAIASELEAIDPAHRAFFTAQLARFDNAGLARYHALIAQIRAHYAGTSVGASESIFALLAPSLGLDLVTPPSFMRAVSEGTEVTAQDTIMTERQLTEHRVRVWIENSQNVTPEIERLDAIARAAEIPVTTVTETLAPAGDSFQAWQVAQLQRLESALHRATGR
jgi:zinc/manganese transport system substrate-binding protein